jgi:hypothetical protein
MTEMLKKFENSSTKTVAEQSMSSQTPLGSVMNLTGDLNRKFEHVPHCREVCSLTLDFVTNNMLIVPHLPYSPDIAPCDFALFSKLKMKLKGQRFETVDIQRELQAVLDSIKENDFHGAFEAWSSLYTFPRRLF